MQNVLNKILAFSIAMMIGLYSAIFYHTFNFQKKTQKASKPQIIKINLPQTKKTKEVHIQKSNESKDLFLNGFKNYDKKDSEDNYDGEGIGNAIGCYGPDSSKANRDKEREKILSTNSEGIKILSKPKSQYTKEARANNVTGKVRLRVTFLKNGSIGRISIVKGLPDGLNEKAIEAAKKIKFKPPNRNGKPYSVNKVVQFNFNIY